MGLTARHGTTRMAPPVKGMSNPRRVGGGVRSFFREAMEALLLGALIFVSARQVVQTFRVEQRSMEPTLYEGQYLVVYKLAYAEFDLQLPVLGAPRAQAAEPSHVVASLGGPQRGDIVVFTNPTSPPQHLIKRVIGMPGETVAVEGGKVYVNGVPIDEPYLKAPPAYYLSPQQVPADHLFVLGDNRNASFDSHHFGPIHRQLLVGKAYPLPLIWPLPGLPRLSDFVRI